MDTLLVQGDHYRDGSGLPVTLRDGRELIQRALIRLQVPRGSFSADPALGSDLHKLRGAHGGSLERLALSYVEEALAPMPEIRVDGVSVGRPGREALCVAVRLRLAGQVYPLEVEVS